jgi:arylsulfatase A-like enzyme
MSKGRHYITQSRWPRVALLGVLIVVGVGGLLLLRARRDAADRPQLGMLPPGVAKSDLNVVVITLDTTRADHLGAYGFQSIATPNIDWLAEEGVRFEAALTAVPLTVPAHASLYTGRFPFHHGVRDNDSELGREETTLAEILRQRGYQTGAFVGAYVLAASRGLNQGFDVYRDDFGSSSELSPSGLRRAADQVADDAMNWVGQVGNRSFFAWLHFYDAHAPYRPVEPYQSMYGTRPYDAQIAFMDAQVGRMVEFLRRRGLLDRTVVVVIGDHGEGLGEHRENGHGVFVYDSVIRVPLIVRTPFSGLRGRIVDDVVRSVDVLPTLLDLIGAPSPAVDGTTLVPLMTGAVASLNLEAYSESLYPLRFGWSDLHSLRAGRFKVIAAPQPELYDLDHDRFEEHNVFDRERSVAERMLARLRDMERPASSAISSQNQTNTDADTAAKLASLGYVSRSTAASPRSLTELPDPKDGIEEIESRSRP